MRRKIELQRRIHELEQARHRAKEALFFATGALEFALEEYRLLRDLGEAESEVRKMSFLR